MPLASLPAPLLFHSIGLVGRQLLNQHFLVYVFVCDCVGVFIMLCECVYLSMLLLRDFWRYWISPAGVLYTADGGVGGGEGGNQADYDLKK